MKRRNLILSGLGLTGALVVGWGVMPPRSRLGKHDNMLLTEGDVALNGWIKIAKDGSVVLAMHRSDMGQGIHNALAMLVAEELDVPLKQVRLEQAGHDAIYGNVAMFVGTLPFHPLKSEGPDKPMMVKTGEWMVSKVARELGVNATGGSSSVKDAWEHLRTAAATAKASLLMSAADQWKVPAKELSVKDGVISHASGKSAHYGEFAKGAAGQTPGNVVLKDRKDWRLIGQATPRADVPAKTNGSAVFGIDVRVPNMLFASIVQVPQMGGTLSSIDAKEALAMPGVVKCVQLNSANGSAPGFAVVAKTTWHAKQAADKVKAQWAQRAEGAIDTKRIEAELKEKLKSEKGFAFYEKGDAAKAEAGAARLIEAQYKAPYLAHATMEPMNCTAQFKGGALEIWSPTQVPGLARAAAAKVANLSEDKVKLNVTLLGGGFGRRLEADVVVQATQIAMGLHIKDGRLQMVVADDGVGIFGKIAESAHLFDTRLAILELAKGKFTTAPEGHSGMGIFVSSRMMDGFAIESRGLRLDPHEATQPLPRFGWIDPNALLKPVGAQTVVRMGMAVDSTRTPNDVYLKYFDPDEVGGQAFHTTEIPVRLAQLSSELVSRSQAKWVMERATQFKTVILDFEGVVHVGQAFVDEVFRVFAVAHPEVRIKTMGMTPEVEKLVRMFGGAPASVQSPP